MTVIDINKKRITKLKYVLVVAALVIFGLEYAESGDPNGKTIAAIGTVFLLLSILRDIGDPASTFKKWFSRVVHLAVILLALVAVVGDLVTMLHWDIPVEWSDIRLWAGLVLVVIVGFVESFLSRIEPASSAPSPAAGGSSPSTGNPANG